MPEKQPVLLKNLLFGKGSALGDLTRRARDFDRITQALRAGLPDDLQPHILAVTVEGKKAVVLTDSSAWASRLRFMTPEIRQALEQFLPKPVEEIEIKVRPK